MKYLKKSFTLLELIFVVLLLAIITSVLIPKNRISKLEIATDKIVLYLNYARYIALIDNKYDVDDIEWERKRWTLKFKRCSSSIGGLYYNVYSDTNGGTAQYGKTDSLKDPMNNKYLYSFNCEEDTLNDKSKYVLLSKEFDIEKVEVSCNTTSTIGQISFGADGKIYSQLGTNIKEIDETCTIKLYDKNNNFNTINIEPKTGYIHKL